MLYKKAKVEIIDFSNQELFMAMSGQAATAWVNDNCGLFVEENPNGIQSNGKFLCSSFTDSQDGTFQHAGNNWFCRSYKE